MVTENSPPDRPTREFRYGKRTWEVVFEAVRAFGRPVSHAEVRDRIATDIPDFAINNVRPDLSMLSVNCPSRGHHYMNRSPRRTDTGSPYDRLIRIGSGSGVLFFPYDPNVHGTWELADVAKNVLHPRFLGTADNAELEQARNSAVGEGLFDPNVDSRSRMMVAIVQREGQPAFRQELLKAYGGRCAISGCSIEALLEAAHIAPYMGAHTNIVANGLLLRADLHKLFDLHFLCIDPETRVVHLSSVLVDSEYSVFGGVRLRDPLAPYTAPQIAMLRHHYERCGWLNAKSDGGPLDE